MLDYTKLFTEIPDGQTRLLQLPDVLKEWGCVTLLLPSRTIDTYADRQVLLAALRQSVRVQMMKADITEPTVIEALYAFVYHTRKDRGDEVYTKLLDFIHRYIAPTCRTADEVVISCQGIVNFSDEGYLYTLQRNLGNACADINQELIPFMISSLSCVMWDVAAGARRGEADMLDYLESRFAGIQEFVTQQEPSPDVLKDYLTESMQRLLMEMRAYLIPNMGFCAS